MVTQPVSIYIKYFKRVTHVSEKKILINNRITNNNAFQLISKKKKVKLI